MQTLRVDGPLLFRLQLLCYNVLIKTTGSDAENRAAQGKNRPKQQIFLRDEKAERCASEREKVSV